MNNISPLYSIVDTSAKDCLAWVGNFVGELKREVVERLDMRRLCHRGLSGRAVVHGDRLQLRGPIERSVKRSRGQKGKSLDLVTKSGDRDIKRQALGKCWLRKNIL